MDHARLELRLSNAPGGSRVSVPGPVDGQVLGALVDPNTHKVLQTWVGTRAAQRLGLTTSVESASGAIEISGQTHILLNRHKTTFKIRRLWVARETGAITHLLLADSSVFAANKPEHVVPLAQIVTIESKGITLASAIHSVEQFPIFRDDRDIAGDVGGVLEQVLLDPRARRNIHARVEDAQVEYGGELDTENENNALLSATRRIPGVRGVRSDIVVVERLASMAAAAIQDLRDKGKLPAEAEIEVLSEHQIIYLNGTVPTTKASSDAESAALGVPGVRIVVNTLQVAAPPSIPRPDPASPRTHNR